MSKQTARIAEERNAKVQRLANLLKPPRLIPEETQLLQSVFGDRPEIYTALRDLFFGFELDNDQKQFLLQIRTISGLIRKIFLPEVKKDISFGNTFDLWQTKDLQTTNLEAADIGIQSKSLMLELLETSLKRLENPELKGVNLDINPDTWSVIKPIAYIQGRNAYISYVDSQIRFLIQHVNMQTMTQEEINLMMQMDSTK